jgi:hypothetical protein
VAWRASITEERCRKQELLAGRPRPDTCEICDRSSTKKLHFDHCHATGGFRGWLCTKCNTALGLLDDNPALIKKLAEYLQ